MSTEAEPPAPPPQGEHLLAELKWVHEMIRRDLGTVRQLARDVAAGAPAGHVEAEVEALRTRGPLWKLRVNCLYYCRFVHSHHNHEDALLFPALRRSDPALDPIVDRLESDHRLVSINLDKIEDSVQALGQEDTARGRERVVEALDGLADLLLEHLDFEEEAIGPTLESWESWPRG